MTWNSATVGRILDTDMMENAPQGLELLLFHAALIMRSSFSSRSLMIHTCPGYTQLTPLCSTVTIGISEPI